MEEVTTELIARIECDCALAVFQVVNEAAFVDILSFLFQSSLTLVLLIPKLSLVDLSLVSRSVSSSD